MDIQIAIIGAGPAGIEAAATLAAQGAHVTLFEQHPQPLCNLTDKALLFPNFAQADQVVEKLSTRLRHPNIDLRVSTTIKDLHREDDNTWTLADTQGGSYRASRVIIATGYTPFDAHRKEELGYGIYPGVYTSLEMEQMLRRGKLETPHAHTPRRVTFLQCVGSRDEKIGNHYCSKLCCITAVKQAIEVCKLYPDVEVTVFYMDLRMWGQGFEELYREAQQKYHVQFVRGRISEASSTFDGRVQIKAEDTLMGLPLKMTTDMLVLMVGMEPSEGTRRLGQACNICGRYGFIESADPHLGDNLTTQPNLFVTGACKRPMTLTDVIVDARSVALLGHQQC